MGYVFSNGSPHLLPKLIQSKFKRIETRTSKGLKFENVSLYIRCSYFLTKIAIELLGVLPNKLGY